MTEDIKKGLLGIVVDETEVSKVMPEINSLTYRGYAAQDLCAKCKFEEVAYLILNGELPNKKQLKNFEKQERNERKLSKTLLQDIKNFPKKAFFGKFFISCNKVLESFLSFLSCFSKFFNCFLFGSSPFNIKYATSSNLHFAQRSCAA